MTQATTTTNHPVLVTGCAGFIGSHLVRRLLDMGTTVIGVDLFLGNQPVSLKNDRLHLLRSHPNAHLFTFFKHDVSAADFPAFMQAHAPKTVIHLAAQAGVRDSITEPFSYARHNLDAFLNVLEGCRRLQHIHHVHLLYASSSSVYGDAEGPLSENCATDAPISFYAATKKSNEHMAHSFSHIHGFCSTGMRFFTVYGPWGRPDMAPMIFADALSQDRTIELFNYGEQTRDFTYVDDVCDGILALKDRQNGRHADVYNIGAGKPVGLRAFVETLAIAMQKKPRIDFVSARPGDVQHTHADTSKLQRDTGVSPATGLKEGLEAFADWYRSYFEEPSHS